MTVGISILTKQLQYEPKVHEDDCYNGDSDMRTSKNDDRLRTSRSLYFSDTDYSLKWFGQDRSTLI